VGVSGFWKWYRFFDYIFWGGQFVFEVGDRGVGIIGVFWGDGNFVWGVFYFGGFGGFRGPVGKKKSWIPDRGREVLEAST